LLWAHSWLSPVSDAPTRRNQAAIACSTRTENPRVVGSIHRIDLQAWARRPPNGAKPIAGGSYRASVTYVVAGQPDVWNGSLSAGPVTLTIP
jgi:hypothetical protein